MNYKNKLQENNAGLQDILEKAQALPKATELPILDNPATAADIASGYEAIGGDGVKMVGAVPEYNDGDIFYNRDTVDFVEENGVQYLVGIPQESALIRPNSVVFSEVPTSWLGDAQPEDVAAGKMFSSSAGFRLVGTAQVGGGLEACTIVIWEYAGSNLYFTYTDKNGVVQSGSVCGSSEAITAAKGTIIALFYDYGSIYVVAETGVRNLYGGGTQIAAFEVIGDGEIAIAY